jgi:signal peptidase II
MHARHAPKSWMLWGLFLGLSALICGLDLWTKAAIFDLLEVQTVGEPPIVRTQKVVEVIPGWFELEATFNRGAFHGWFSEHTGYLTVLSAVAWFAIAAMVFVAIRSEPRPSAWFIVALGLIGGGTLGNLYDRYYIGAVRDWIKWFVVTDGRERVWPNFNIADSGICVGVGTIILLEVLRAWRRDPTVAAVSSKSEAS